MLPAPTVLCIIIVYTPGVLLYDCAYAHNYRGSSSARAQRFLGAQAVSWTGIRASVRYVYNIREHTKSLQYIGNVVVQAQSITQEGTAKNNVLPLFKGYTVLLGHCHHTQYS